MAFQRAVPKIGVLTNSIGVFDNDAKERAEGALQHLFDELIEAGAIDRGSLLRGRIFGPHEATAVANEFAAACVDLIILVNSAFPNGQVFLTLATHPNLAKVPLAVVAEPEAKGGEWTTNAWCGVIMNNYVAKQLGRHIEAIPGPIDGTAFRRDIDRLLRVAGTIKSLRNDFLGRVGEAPGGFHCASGNQVAFAATFGTRVDTVDLTAIVETLKTGTAKGYLGEARFTDADVQKTIQEVSTGREVLVKPEMLEKGVRLYHAIRSVVQANGYTSLAVRCWPETGGSLLGVSACFVLGLLEGKGDVSAAACESDWPTAVAQTIGASLTGSPAACLDWVNYTAGSDIIQLGHCGVGICGKMAPNVTGARSPRDAIALQPVERRAGWNMGPALIGQFEFGRKTGICLTQSAEGRFRMLAFGGESSEETACDMCYSASDIRVPDPKRLSRLILDGGFPHHLAMAFGDIAAELRMLCGYLGVDYFSPDGEE
jgi:L-fucose isomerase-like protein